MPNKYINCIDCRTEFEFTERDQEFFEKNEFSTPKRCKPCRAKKKARNQNRNQNQEHDYS